MQVDVLVPIFRQGVGIVACRAAWGTPVYWTILYWTINHTYFFRLERLGHYVFFSVLHERAYKIKAAHYQKTRGYFLPGACIELLSISKKSSFQEKKQFPAPFPCLFYYYYLFIITPISEENIKTYHR